MISVTLLPMTLIAGVYGMNFAGEGKTIWWPSLENEYGMPLALLLMLLSGVGALGFFRWMKWI